MKHLFTMKYLNRMKYINTMKHIITMKSRRVAICAITLFCLLCAITIQADTRTYGTGEKLYFKQYPSAWSWFGNDLGTGNHVFAYFFGSGGYAWSNEATIYKGGILQVTVPAGTWTHVIFTRQSGTTPDWSRVYSGNQSEDIPLANRATYIQNFRQKSTSGDIGRWVSTTTNPTPSSTSITCYDDGSHSIACEKIDVCQQSIDAGDLFSLMPVWKADQSDYNYVDPHVWVKWDASSSTWIPISDDWGDYTESLANVDHVYYYLWTGDKTTERFIHLNRVSCAVTCNITSFEYVKTPVNVNDSTFAFEGSVAFTKAAGNLKISFGSTELIITDPKSPQVFSLKGLKADGTTDHLIAQFEDDASCIADSIATAPEPTSGIVTYDSKLDPSHYSPSHETYIHGTNVTLTPSVLVTDSFAWTDSKGAIKYSSRTGGDNHYTVPGFGHDTTLILYYTEFNDPPIVDDNMMGNGYYENTTSADENKTTSQYVATSDYKYTGVWGGLNTKHDVYDNGYSNQNGLFGITDNANTFWKRMAHISPKRGDYMAVYDGDDDEKVAWRASTSGNPHLTLTKGTTYMFSFWVANVNNYGEMVNQGNKNGAVLQFKINYTDTNGDPHEAYLGEAIDLSDYMDNLWHQNSSTFTSDADAETVTISVVDKNDAGISIGNDFALDDIRFRAVSIQSGTVRTREQFTVKYVEPKTNPVNLQVEWVTKPKCGADTCTMKVSFRYPNITMHDIKLILKDINTVNSFGTLVDKAVLSKTPITGNPDSTDYVAYFTSGTYAGATYNEKVKADAATHNFKAQLIVLDAEEIDHGDYTNATLGAIAKPVLEIKRCEVIAPTCGYETYSLEVDVDYTAQSGAELKYYIDDVSKGTPKSITYEVTSRSKNDVTLYSLPADGKEHTLKVTTGHALDCIATTKFTAPMANTITAFAVEPIQPDCDVETYTLRATWTVTKPADGVYDALMIKVGTATPYEIPITASNATGDNAKFDIPITYTIGDDHPAIKAYMKERGATCYETGIYSDPTTPRMTIGKPTFEDIECNKETFDLVVPVTYTYQHGRMWAWIDDKTSEKIEITASGNCKTGGAYQGYLAESTSSRTTHIVFNDVTLSGDHKVSVECDGDHSCHRTKALGTAKDFSAPLLPKASLVTPITMPSVAACDQLTFDLTVSIKFTNQDGDLQVKVDDGSWKTFYTPSESAGEGKYIKNSAEQTKSVKLTGLPADGGTTHKIYYRFNKEGYCGYDIPLESDELTFPQSPTVTSTTVSATPSAVACDATDYTRTVTVEYKNGYGKKIIVEDEEGNELYKSSAALTSSNGTITPTVTLTAIDGASHYVIAYFEGYSCKSTDPHKGTYTAPVKPIITDVTVTSVSDKTCGAPEYTVSGTVSYTNVPSDTKITVAYDATHKTEITVKTPASDTKEFSISGITATGSELTVQAYFNSTTCSKTSNKFASPTAPSMEIKNIKQSTPGCDDLKYNLTFDVDYTYQYGNLTVHVDTYGDTVITIPETSRKKATLQTVHVTYTGKIPADGNTHTLTAQFGGTGSCSSSKTLSAVLSPVITDLSVSVPTDPIDCEATSYLASVTVETEYAIGKHVYIVYKNKSDEDVKYGPYEITESPQTFSSLSFADVGAITPRSVRVYLSERDTCEKTRSYSIPPTTSIAPFTVGITDRSTCDGVLYDIEGDIAYTSKPADANPAVRFGTYKAAMTAIGETSAHYKFTGVTTEGEDLTVEAYFTNKPKCFVSSDKFNSPLKPDVEAVNQKMADPVCNETTTSLTFDIRYTKQPAGMLTVWLDDAPVAKHQEISYMANDGSETPTTIEDVTISGITADGNTHTLHIKFSNGCTRTFTTPVAKFSPKITSEDVSITGESCGSEYYTATVTFTVANGQGKNVTVTGKDKTDAKAAVDGENTFIFTNVKRTYSDTSDDLFEIYFDEAQPSCSHIVASFTENPFMPIPEAKITSVASQCDYETKTTVTYTTKDAATYKYYIVGKTALSAAATAAESGTFDLDISSLSAGDYTLKLVSNSANCVSDTASATFTIYPKPQAGITSVADQCDYETKTTVTYTTKDAATYKYYIVGKTALSAAATASESGTFDLDISSLSAGDYTLKLVSNSANCVSDTASATFTIYPKPQAGITSVSSQCDYETKTPVTYTTKDAVTYKYYIVGETALSAATTASESGTFDLDISSLSAGDYTLKLVSNSANCVSDTASATFTIYPKPQAGITSVADQCDYETKTTVTYTTKDAATYKYYIVGKTALSAAATAAESGTFDLDISGLSAGTYTLKLVSNSANCVSDTASATFTIYPEPKAGITSVADQCDYETKTTVTYTTKDAATYKYYIVGKTALSAAATAAESGTFDLDISSLSAGDYTLKLVSNSANCVSDTASATFTIYPKPQAGITSVADQCDYETKTTVTYTTKDAATYKYYIVGKTALSAATTAAESGTFDLDISSLNAGDYTLKLVSNSANCVSDTASATFTIYPKPQAGITSVSSQCDYETKTTVTYTTKDAATYKYYIVGRTALSAAATAAESGTFDLDISSLSAGDYTLKLVSNSANCVSDTASATFTIYPSPELAFDAIALACHPASSVEVTYTQTNTKSFTYTVKTKDGSVTKISDETVTVDAALQFTITTDTWAAGEYTLTAVAKSNNGCTTNADPINFTILPKPAIEAIGVGSLCKGGTAAYLTLNAKNATHYRYYIVGKTALSDKIAIGASTVDLPSDLEPGQYKFKLVALSETCHSDTAECDFNIWPLPTFNFKLGEVRDCHPSTGINVGYTSTNAKTYSYTLTLEGKSTPSLAENNLTASAESVIALNTTGLAAGTYDLVVTAKSEHNCDLPSSASRKVIIQAKPTVTINSVENHCAGNASISVSYSTTDATTYYYEVLGTGLQGHADAAATGSFTIDISSLEPDTYTLRMKATAGQCESDPKDKGFDIYPIPTVGFVTPAPIKEGVANVTVTLNLTDATRYDWRFIDKDGSTELESGNNVLASQTTITLTTGALEEGTYTLYVTPYSATCDGVENNVHVVVNNKPTVNFTEPDIVCAGSSTLNVEYSTSPDATDLYYTIKQGATTIVSEQHVDLTATASPLPVNISGLTYGTYTLTGYVRSALERGDDSSVDFTLMAVLSENDVKQDLAFIGCEETYDATITVNIFNAAGRKIYAKYTDDGDHTLHVETSAGDLTATINLTDLTHTDLSGKHEVKVYVDGFEDCGITVGYDEPKLMTITEGFEVKPLPKSCGDEKFTITGTVVANCNEGKIVVEYNDIYKDVVDASTSGSDFTIADIPAGGGVTKLKAYFQGKTCGVVESAEFAEPTKPEASIAYTPYVTPLCDVSTFNLEFTLDYTYQEAGTLTVWVDEDHKNTYNSADSKYDVLASKTQLTGTIGGLPADGRTGQKLYYEFSGPHSCKGSIDLDAFPQTPLITDVSVTNVPDYIAALEGTYTPIVTVTYIRATGDKRIVLEYLDKEDKVQTAYSSSAVFGDGSYPFDNLTFDDVTKGDRVVHAYFEGSDCKSGKGDGFNHDGEYKAPTNSSIKFESLELINTSTCDALQYTVKGTVSFVGAVLGDLIVEFDDSNKTSISKSQCEAVTPGTPIPFEIAVVGVNIPDEGKTLTAYYFGFDNSTLSDEKVYEPAQPSLAIDDVKVDTTFSCDSKRYDITVTVSSANQHGTCYVLDSIAGGAVRTVATHESTYNGSDKFSIPLPATNELHYVVVRYPATGCEVISSAIDINTYTKPKPLISLTAIDRLCNSETELSLPFAITQGDIVEATLTLTDSKGKNVITAADLTINDSKDTLSYTLLSQLAAGKYTATVEASDTLDCVTSAKQSIEFALDGVVFSKWTDVLLVDNADGLFTGYQWYENDKLLDGQTGQVLYLPKDGEGMNGNSYYCRLQTADGTIYTCEDLFEGLPRSADNPKQPTSNHITVLPNRVAANGAVTVRQSANENLHLILMSATGKRVAEYTQQEATKLIDMPGVQGIYLLRVEAESDVQTVKIVVY